MPFTENKGVRLHWEEAGSGTPILLVMGHRYSSKMWYPAIPALAAEHRVIWFDNRGTGESQTTPKVTLPQMAADALAVMDAAGARQAHIYGVSMGGAIVQEVAFQQPGRVLSLIVGCSGALTADKPRMPAIMRTLYYLPPWMLKLLMSGRRGDLGYGSAAAPEAIAVDQAVLAKDKFTVKGLVAQAAAIAAYSATREAVAGLPGTTTWWPHPTRGTGRCLISRARLTRVGRRSTTRTRVRPGPEPATVAQQSRGGP